MYSKIDEIGARGGDTAPGVRVETAQAASPQRRDVFVDGRSGVPAICMRVRYRVAVTGW